MNKIKENWFLPILGTLLVILDYGFDAVNPLLLALKIPNNYIEVIKAVFGIYGIYRIAKNKSI